MAAAAVDAYGRIDLVVTAAGTNKVAMIEDFDPADWQAVMDANVRGSWLVAQAAGKRMIAQGDGGRVVLVSSTRGKLGLPNGYTAYCPSKAAVDGLTEGARLRVGQARHHRQRDRPDRVPLGAHRLDVRGRGPGQGGPRGHARAHPARPPGRARGHDRPARLPALRRGAAS